MLMRTMPFPLRSLYQKKDRTAVLEMPGYFGQRSNAALPGCADKKPKYVFSISTFNF